MAKMLGICLIQSRRGIPSIMSMMNMVDIIATIPVMDAIRVIRQRAIPLM